MAGQGAIRKDLQPSAGKGREAACHSSADVIETLRRKITAIEHRFVLAEQSSEQPDEISSWRTGAGEIDAHIGISGLEIGAVHEIKPDLGGWMSAAAKASASAFVFALTARRLGSQKPQAANPFGLPGSASRSSNSKEPDVLVCAPAVYDAEFGAVYGPGLSVFGIDPERLLIVSPKRTEDALWALEEGLRSGALAAVIGHLDDVALTPARRLALAAAETRTPCLLLTHPRSTPAGATATRWRVSPCPSAPHPLVAGAPGALRFAVSLERCRSAPPLSTDCRFVLEWCDETFRLRLVSKLSDRASAARKNSRPERRPFRGAA